MATPTLPATELDDELNHIRNLVFIRNLLRARGASIAEVRECDVVIEDARARLTDAAGQDASRLASAA